VRGTFGRKPAEGRGEHGKQHQDQHHGEILDDEPADCNAAIRRFGDATALECLEQHHGARNRERQPEHQCTTRGPAPKHGGARAERGRDEHLDHRTRKGDLANRQQVVDGEVKAHAKHEQHYADFRQLMSDLGIRDKARRGGADDNTRKQITDQCRKAQSHGDKPQDQGKAEPRRQGCDQTNGVRHRSRRVGIAMNTTPTAQISATGP
jgi:hypothetical protein